ncbi:MAG TPA: hypothetical protein DCY91_13745 [Cyanobacteria bacterium UBA11370]|nr:hypothetical protein [Cyanobacteria bacterium UBA11370]HBY75915.1 hypothetical protein [Cyanobacteria bacterium UBA11148]
MDSTPSSPFTPKNKTSNWCAAHGKKKAADTTINLDDSQIESLIDHNLYYQFKDELEILEGAGASLDLPAVHRGEMTPVYSFLH